jgi:hypothetical protein
MAKAQGVITIQAIKIARLLVQIEGDTPLICHRWSEKAKRQMLDKQMKKATPKKEAKDPVEDFRSSLYPHPEGGYGFPSVAFKMAMTGACRYVEGVPMTVARGAFFVEGEMVKIQGEPTMREDMVRVGMGTADIRYRGEFREWRAELLISYNASVLTDEQVVNLLNIAGFAVGVGEYRPERDGPYGRFHVAGLGS